MILDIPEYLQDMNEIFKKYVSCSICFKKDVTLKRDVNFLSLIGITTDKVVFYCNDCKKGFEPMNDIELRDKKITNILKD